MLRIVLEVYPSRGHKLRSTRDRNILRSLQKRVSTKISISQLRRMFNMYTSQYEPTVGKDSQTQTRTITLCTQTSGTEYATSHPRTFALRITTTIDTDLTTPNHQNFSRCGFLTMRCTARFCAVLPNPIEANLKSSMILTVIFYLTVRCTAPHRTERFCLLHLNSRSRA